MPCPACARNTLQSLLGTFTSKGQAHAWASNAIPLPRASSLSGRYNQKNFRSSSTWSSRTNQLPFINGTRALHVTKRSLKSSNHNEEPSGLGAAGQQAKDLQDHVSSMVEISDGRPNKRNNAAEKGTKSTPARLARRERRRPRRRFEGDRTRPQVKQPSSSKAARIVQEQAPRQTVSTRDSGKHKGSRTRTADDSSRKNAGDAMGALGKLEGKKKKPRWRDRPPSGIQEESVKSAKQSPKPTEHDERDQEQSTHEQRPPWEAQKQALRLKFGSQGWMPRKRLSPDALSGIRTLHAQYPETYSTPTLAEHFKVSPEAIRRILKSKWTPNEEEDDKRKRRWEKRGENIWSEMSKQGIKPPRPWREKGIGRLSDHDRDPGSGGDRRRRRSSFTALEEEIGTESNRDVITTTTGVGEKLGIHDGSLAHKIL